MAKATAAAEPAIAPEAVLPPPPRHTVSHMLGEITWLMTQSPLHKHFALGDLEWMVMPALLLEQYRVFRDGDKPVSVAFWGFLSEEAEAKLSSGTGRLRPDEWKSGDRCWIVEIVVPFATTENQMVARMLTDLSEGALRDKLIKLIVNGPPPEGRRVVEVRSIAYIEQHVINR